MHRQQVTVLCGFWYGGIIGPFFFKNEQGAAVVVSGERYCAMLNEFFFQKLKRMTWTTFVFNRAGPIATQPT